MVLLLREEKKSPPSFVSVKAGFCAFVFFAVARERRGEAEQKGKIFELDSRTVARLFFIAMTAAMKNVLSPISEAKIIDAERTKPSSKRKDDNHQFGILVAFVGNIFPIGKRTPKL